MKTNIVFRVDSSSTIGAGHVVRCVALANEIAMDGHVCWFLYHEMTPHLESVIKQNRHNCIPLCSTLSGPAEQEFKELNDANLTIKTLLESSIDPAWIVVDHYHISDVWHQMLKQTSAKILVVDDLANRSLDADLLINPNPGFNRQIYSKLVSDRCTVLQGVQYSLLRNVFLSLRKQALQKRENARSVKRVLINFGGTDRQHLIEIVLTALNDLNLELYIDLITNKSSFKHLSSNCLYEFPNLMIHAVENANDMAERMLLADFSIGACGTSSWERCCLGLPSAVVKIADNQEHVQKSLIQSGASADLGCINLLDQNRILAVLKKCLLSVDSLKSMSQAGFSLVDGMGVRRVRQEMLQKKSKLGNNISFRPVEVKDKELVFEWQQDRRTRQYANNPVAPNIKEHESWFAKNLNTTQKFYEMILSDNEPAGTLHVDSTNPEKSLVSIYLKPSLYGCGIGRVALEYLDRLFRDQDLFAEIHKENSRSRSLFESMGYVSTNDNLYIRHAKGDNASIAGVK